MGENFETELGENEAMSNPTRIPMTLRTTLALFSIIGGAILGTVAFVSYFGGSESSGQPVTAAYVDAKLAEQHGDYQEDLGGIIRDMAVKQGKTLTIVENLEQSFSKLDDRFHRHETDGGLHGR